MSFYRETRDMGEPERRFDKQEYIDRHRELLARHSEAAAGGDMSWLRKYGDLLDQSRYHLEYDYALTPEEIDAIERTA